MTNNNDNNPKRAPHFLEVFLPSLSSDRLKLPLKFVARMEGKVSGSVVLMGPSGNLWKVDLVNHNGDLYFQNGWADFVRDHSIQCGDSLVFRYDGYLRFTVLIFDESASEKDEAFHATCSQQPKHCRGTIGRKREREERPPFSFKTDEMHRRMKRIFTPVYLAPPSRSSNLRSNVEEAKRAHLGSPVMTEKMSEKLGSDGCYEQNENLMDETVEVSSSSGAENGLKRCRTPIVAGLRAGSLGDALTGKSSENAGVPMHLDRRYGINKKMSSLRARRLGDALTSKSSENAGVPIHGDRGNGFNKKKSKKKIEKKISISALVENKVAKHFNSEFPFFVRVMKFSNVYGNRTLKLPVQFSMAHLPKTRAKVVIRNLKGDCWTLTSIPTVRPHTVQQVFSRGWRGFVKDNGIKMADVCIFESVGNCEMRFRTLGLTLDEVIRCSKAVGSGGSPAVCAESSSKNAIEIRQNNPQGDSELIGKLHTNEEGPSGMKSMTETEKAEEISPHSKEDDVSWKCPFTPISCPVSMSSNGKEDTCLADVDFDALFSDSGECMIAEPDGTKHDPIYRGDPMGLKDGGAQGPSSADETALPVSFKSSFPTFMKVMKISNTKESYILRVPHNFSVAHLPNCKTEIVLRNMKGQCWIVNSMPVSSKSGRHVFCGGWCTFVRENGVKSGDSCVFELVGKREMRVHIFGAHHRGLECESSEAAVGQSIDLDPMEHNVLAGS